MVLVNLYNNNTENKLEAGGTNRCPTIYKGCARRQPKLLCMCVGRRPFHNYCTKYAKAQENMTLHLNEYISRDN